LDEALATLSDRPPLALKVAAGVAAAGGRWDEVLRLTGEPVTGKVVNDLHVLRMEALAAVGRFDEALSLAAEPYLDDYWADMQRICLLRAAIALVRCDAAGALGHLRPVIESTRRDPRPLALAMHVAALLAVTAHRLGHDDDAAKLFGFVAAERQRLLIDVRPGQRAIVDEGASACRSSLGETRFAELAASGAATTWHALVDASATISEH
jgi:hypothetical protein